MYKPGAALNQQTKLVHQLVAVLNQQTDPMKQLVGALNQQTTPVKQAATGRLSSTKAIS